MNNKPKKLVKQVMSYLSVEEHKELDKITKKKGLSYNQYMRDALNLKLSMDNNTKHQKLRREADELLERLEARTKELKQFNGMKDY